MAIGFVIISIGAQVALSEGLAGAKWLLLTYLFHTIGELILSPIGLAAISPGIIAFSLYSKIQKILGASITGFTLYLFVVY